MSTPSKDYRPTLDGWRAIAILLVMFEHCGGALFEPGGRFPNPTWFGISQHGVFGVDLFFGISGLLICGRLLDENDRTGGISLRSFYTRRVFRIIPPAFAYLATIALLAIVGVIVVTPREWLCQPVLLPQLHPDSAERRMVHRTLLVARRRRTLLPHLAGCADSTRRQSRAPLHAVAGDRRRALASGGLRLFPRTNMAGRPIQPHL